MLHKSRHRQWLKIVAKVAAKATTTAKIGKEEWIGHASNGIDGVSPFSISLSFTTWVSVCVGVRSTLSSPLLIAHEIQLLPLAHMIGLMWMAREVCYNIPNFSTPLKLHGRDLSFKACHNIFEYKTIYFFGEYIN